MEPKRLETLEYLAKRLNITRDLVYTMKRTGVLKPPVLVRINKRSYRINVEELEKAILENTLGISKEEN